jgi:hypothetical protein
MAWWEDHFGRIFPSVQPFLVPCPGKRADFYPCPDNPAVRLSICESGHKYRAVPTGEHADAYEDVGLDWKDVQAHKLGISRISDALRGTFKLLLAPSLQLDNLDYIGRCDCNGVFRQVYACFADTSPAALTAVSPITDVQTVGCVLFPTHHSAATEFLNSRGISSVILRDCLSLDGAGFSGECPKTCIRCRPADISNIELKKHLDVRLDALETTVIPNAVRGTATVHSASAGGKARATSYLQKYADAKKFIHEYHQKNPVVSFSAARKKAAQHLYLSEATLKNHVKKGDFVDW